MSSTATDTAAAFDLVRKKKTRYVIYKIKDLNIIVDKVSHRNNTYKDLMEDISDTSPAYIIYDYEYLTHDNRPADKMYFIYWKPHNTSQSERIVYSQALHNFRIKMNGVENQDIEDEDGLSALLKKEVPDTRKLSKE